MKAFKAYKIGKDENGNEIMYCNPNGNRQEYKEGETYELAASPICCDTGFHACDNPLDTGEIAISVCSNWRGKGVGEAMLVALINKARELGLARRIKVAASALVSGWDFTEPGESVGALAAEQVYEAAGIGPEEVDVVELHDCFTANELLTYEALGLCPEGGAEKFIWDEDNTYGGKVVTNPSGGLLSKGHPLGATGLAQCTELVWQLRGTADQRQVAGARVALQHNLGLGGACVVTMYRRD